MKKNTFIALLVIVFTLTIAVSTASACYPCRPGTGTPGYWINHPEAWPVDYIEIGIQGEDPVQIPQAEALAWMMSPVKKDKSITMFTAYAAFFLNVENRTETSGEDCIVDGHDFWYYYGKANSWLWFYPVGSGQRANKAPWQCGEYIYEYMDAYNNGDLCAPSRDIYD